MRERGGTWAAYQNQAMDSADFGHLQFLKYGPGCTHESAPFRFPDTAHGLGWKYRLIGNVDLTTGEINARAVEVDSR
jgi:hypothetical protein